MLAAGPYIVEVNGEAATLRPTLRAGLRLTRKPGLPAVFRGVQEGSLSIVSDLIAETADQVTASRITKRVELAGMMHLATMRPVLLALLADLVMADEPQANPAPKPSKPATPGKLITREQSYCELFQFATGNLGWTPTQAWEATPAEIVAAQAGRRNLLISIFGNGEKPEPKPAGNLADQAKAAMASLGGKIIKRTKKASDA
jgi:hypothetical protein